MFSIPLPAATKDGVIQESVRFDGTPSLIFCQVYLFGDSAIFGWQPVEEIGVAFMELLFC